MEFGTIIKIGMVFVSNDYDKFSPYVFAVTLNDFKPNVMLISMAKKYKCWKNFIEFYKLGFVYFENQKIKKIAGDIIYMFSC